MAQGSGTKHKLDYPVRLGNDRVDEIVGMLCFALSLPCKNKLYQGVAAFFSRSNFSCLVQRVVITPALAYSGCGAGGADPSVTISRRTLTLSFTKGAY